MHLAFIDVEKAKYQSTGNFENIIQGKCLQNTYRQNKEHLCHVLFSVVFNIVFDEVMRRVTGEESLLKQIVVYAGDVVSCQPVERTLVKISNDCNSL